MAGQAQSTFCCCSAIQLPATNYPLYESISDDIVDNGKLSQLQLESVLYACTKHLNFLPSGESKAHRQAGISQVLSMRNEKDMLIRGKLTLLQTKSAIFEHQTLQKSCLNEGNSLSRP